MDVQVELPAKTFSGPEPTKPFKRYTDRMNEARHAAGTGMGWEDLVVECHITPRDAHRIVFGR